MKVLVVGSGGREHALAWKLTQSPRVTKVFVAPGSDGIAQVKNAQCVQIPATAIDELVNFAFRDGVELTVVGPEVPLVNGIVDRFQEKGLMIFGPTQAAAQLEGSKVFAKKFMTGRGIPTARYQPFTNPDHAINYIRESNVPWVVKADGLAGGKGVIVTSTVSDSIAAVRCIMQDRIFGDAGRQVILEERLDGEEVSMIGIADGHHAALLLLESAKDHKRLRDDDQGPNTGGMGAYSPASVVTDALLADIRDRILKRTVMGMAIGGTPFCGFLYAGLMITQDGPKVLEYNVRLGDPETQALLPRLKTDLAHVLLEAVGGHLNQVTLEWDPRPCVCVVLASEGYPEHPRVGDVITGIEKAEAVNDVLVFHAGTRRAHGQWVTDGGRALNVVAFGSTHEEAIRRAYDAERLIQFKGKQIRRDIGRQAIRSSR